MILLLDQGLPKSTAIRIPEDRMEATECAPNLDSRPSDAGYRPTWA
jgi:hypothetical protein